MEKNVCTGMMIIKFIQDGREVGNAGFNDDETERMTNAINEFMITGNIHY
jgi:hypothetical protein